MTKSKIMALMLVFVMLFTVVLVGCGEDKPVDKPNNQPSGDDKDNNDNNDEESNTNQDGEELAEEQVLRINYGTEPPGLDPQVVTGTTSFSIIKATREGLIRLGANGEITKGSGLAEDWTISEDGLKYTFKLKDVKWSDGTPITSEDFKFAWLRALSPETASEYAYMLYHIKGGEAYHDKKGSREDVAIKTPDAKTIEVELVRPTPFFLELTAFGTYVPAQKAAVEKYGDQYAADADKMVYSGPFIIKEWNHDQNIVLEKNPNYWDKDSVKLERIEGDMIGDNNSIANLYDTGGLDFIAVADEFIDKYKSTDEYAIVPSATTWWLQYNLTDKIMSNYHIRAALSQALDAEGFVKNVKNGVGLAAKGLTVPTFAGKGGKTFGECLESKRLPFDVAAAKDHLEKGLAELGMTKEELQEELTFLAGDTGGWMLMTEAFQQMWKDNLGLDIFVQNVSFAIRLDKYNKKDYKFSLAGWGADYNDALTFMDMFVTDGGNNDAYFSNKEYDECIKTAIEGTGDERIDAMLRAEDILSEELAIYPVYHTVADIVQRPYVKGIIRPACGTSEYKWAYLLKH
ncbi:peptide ABC transporter substrate-binding protein [Clostridiaceae bacterium M8S5]|nr:peptide ABC transporter substrate-binding protein [Clostridiaceae bacterium M8S5]